MQGCEWIDGAQWAWQAATLAAAQGDHTQVTLARAVALASIALAAAAWAHNLYRRAHWWKR